MIRKAFKVPNKLRFKALSGSYIKINGELLSVSHTQDHGTEYSVLVAFTVPEYKLEEIELEDGKLEG